MHSLLEILMQPFATEFMRKAVLASVLLGTICGLVGTYVVLRKMAFLAGALCHTILPGVALGYFHKFNILICALSSSVLAAVGISALTRNGRLREDTAIGIVFTTMFAIGIIYISSQQSFRDLTAILFGNILAVTNEDLLLLSCLLFLSIMVLTAFYKEIMLSTLDEDYARSIGVPVEGVRLIVVILTAVAVVFAMQAVGVVMTAALLITPAASAYLLTKRLLVMVLLSCFFATSSAVAGLYVSWYGNLPTGPVIVLCATFQFLASFLWTSIQVQSCKLVNNVLNRVVST